MVVAMVQILWKFLTSELSALSLFLQLLWLASYQDLDQHLLENLVKKNVRGGFSTALFFFSLFLPSRLLQRLTASQSSSTPVLD
ncbi:hypothetical protein HanRHA438_Chr01g0002161 [Helianthus annuus]|nr:hypothetical protein HanRHA438_Chr01g0002161 [Helianthus annuus]